jgi:undecaprenyl-diphosphatase
MEEFALWQVLVLAVVQGITEFLPVSSDGHLAIVEPLIWRSSAARPGAMDLTIVLHLGTLGSILVYYWRRIVQLVLRDWRVVWLIGLGTVPAVALVLVAKLLLDDVFEPILKSTFLAGWMLPVTGAALLYAQRKSSGVRDYRELSAVESILIGAAQAAAILPGLSRSGSTISAALVMGLSRPAAATYSFLLAIPALAGAGFYEAVSLVRDKEPLSTTPLNLLIGAIVAFVVGLAAISALTRVLQGGRLHYFAWYCIGLGVIVIALNWPT